MEHASVYFTDFHVPVGTSQLAKLRRLIDAAGLGKLDLVGKAASARMGMPIHVAFQVGKPPVSTAQAAPVRPGDALDALIADSAAFDNIIVKG